MPTPEKSFEQQSQVPFKKVVTTRPTEQPKGAHQSLRLGTIESRAEEPEPFKPQKPVEIIKAYQKYPEVAPPPPPPPAPPVQEVKAPIDTSKMTQPRVIEPLHDQPLYEGDQALFECRLQGHPLNVQWFKGDNEIKNQFRYKIAYDDKTGTARLLISTVFDDDAGKYTCKASNPIGECSTTANLGQTSSFILKKSTQLN